MAKKRQSKSEPISEKPKKRLCYKRRCFVEAYLKTWNATRAAKAAGYAHPTKQGSRLLTFVEVSEAIEGRLKELALSADEVLSRLSEQATANVADFFAYAEDGTVQGIDTEMLRERGHLVKKVKVDPDKIELELYDGQNALALMGKHHQLFVENVNVKHSGIVTLVGIDPDEPEQPEQEGGD
jgi:hypothetical protein